MTFTTLILFYLNHLDAQQMLMKSETKENEVSKQMRNMDNWKRTWQKSKEIQDSGISPKKVLKLAPRPSKPSKDHQCRYECASFYWKEWQQSKYWKLGSCDLLTAFLSSCMEVSHPKGRPTNAISLKSSASSWKVNEDTYNSHYSRFQNPNTTYLSPNLDIKNLFALKAVLSRTPTSVLPVIFNKIK